MNVYNRFIQLFSEQFKEEVACEHDTIQNIITLLNKCGLKDLLERVPEKKTLEILKKDKNH